MKYVRALADGAWLEVPIPIVQTRRCRARPARAPAAPARCARSSWRASRASGASTIDGVPVDYGLVVSFREAAATRAGSSTQPQRALACRRCGGRDRHLLRGRRRAALRGARTSRAREQERGKSSARGVGHSRKSDQRAQHHDAGPGRQARGEVSDDGIRPSNTVRRPSRRKPSPNMMIFGSSPGFASVFGNRDLGGDVVVEGAFKKSLAQHGLPSHPLQPQDGRAAAG